MSSKKESSKGGRRPGVRTPEIRTSHSQPQITVRGFQAREDDTHKVLLYVPKEIHDAISKITAGPVGSAYLGLVMLALQRLHGGNLALTVDFRKNEDAHPPRDKPPPPKT